MEHSDIEEEKGALAPGRVVSGRYQIRKLLGAGQMGAVYLVHDRMLDHECAMKVLHAELGKRRDFRERFLREVKLMHKVNHVNVVRTFDIGQEGALTYFTMEYLQGKSLYDVLGETGILPLPRALKLMEQLCLGLQAIHEADIIHRDLKPANIIVVADDVIKISDFGVARPKDSHLTQHGKMFGTMSYMAPEGILGQPVTPAFDCYSLGIIFYEMLLGEPPFIADEQAGVMLMHVEKRPTAPREINPAIPPWLNQLVLRLLEKRPDRRLTPSLVAEIIAARRENPASLSGEQEAITPDPGFAHTKVRYTSKARRGANFKKKRKTRNAVVLGIILMWVLLGVIGAVLMGVGEFFSAFSTLWDAAISR